MHFFPVSSYLLSLIKSLWKMCYSATIKHNILTTHIISVQCALIIVDIPTPYVKTSIFSGPQTLKTRNGFSNCHLDQIQTLFLRIAIFRQIAQKMNFFYFWHSTKSGPISDAHVKLRPGCVSQSNRWKLYTRVNNNNNNILKQ